MTDSEIIEAIVARDKDYFEHPKYRTNHIQNTEQNATKMPNSLHK